ncbi:oxidoreductase [Capsulimonas corticalis]|uniref:Oxidoreductase n=1 Tax=Capsulimonas corticalis TaxID=2219043 RepID=A0A402D0E9_9BACT|nr:aldo/keto reductase [Capsulimonas corticalis]BDI33630.1 oxidoreductase [Capsulimonas corticalis]
MTTRRDFLRTGAAFAAGAAAISIAGSAEAKGADQRDPRIDVAPEAGRELGPTPQTTFKGDMPYRKLGSTGEEVSLIGLGGFHIGSPDSDADGIKLIHTALDKGVNFLDNCWDYHNGGSETRMGKALAEGGYRDKAFLMTKIDGRTSASAASQIDESLKRLQTDRIDLLQFHEILRMEDPDRIFAKGGALEAVLTAKAAGKVRHIGFTGHKDPLVHRRMLEVADSHGFHFDTVQMPVNVMDAHFRSFTHQVIPIANQKEIAVIAMKTFGDHFILDRVLADKLAAPIEMLHYSMTLPVAVVVTGVERMEILDQALEAARTFKPLTKTQVASLLDRTKIAAADGSTELFKISTRFDGTAHNPDWLG